MDYVNNAITDIQRCHLIFMWTWLATPQVFLSLGFNYVSPCADENAVVLLHWEMRNYEEMELTFCHLLFHLFSLSFSVRFCFNSFCGFPFFPSRILLCQLRPFSFSLLFNPSSYPLCDFLSFHSSFLQLPWEIIRPTWLTSRGSALWLVLLVMSSVFEK